MFKVNRETGPFTYRHTHGTRRGRRMPIEVELKLKSSFVYLTTFNMSAPHYDDDIALFNTQRTK